jgi:hypothetical protein
MGFRVGGSAGYLLTDARCFARIIGGKLSSTRRWWRFLSKGPATIAEGNRPECDFDRCERNSECRSDGFDIMQRLAHVFGAGPRTVPLKITSWNNQDLRKSHATTAPNGRWSCGKAWKGCLECGGPRSSAPLAGNVSRSSFHRAIVGEFLSRSLCETGANVQIR